MLESAKNTLTLTARIVEVKTLRYTPAGVPVLELLLEHQAEVTEAGRKRQVQLTIVAVAMGDIGLLLADCTLGTYLEATGFLAATRKGSRRLNFHIQKAQRLSAGYDPSSV